MQVSLSMSASHSGSSFVPQQRMLRLTSRKSKAAAYFNLKPSKVRDQTYTITVTPSTIDKQIGSQVGLTCPSHGGHPCAAPVGFNSWQSRKPDAASRSCCIGAIMCVSACVQHPSAHSFKAAISTADDTHPGAKCLHTCNAANFRMGRCTSFLQACRDSTHFIPCMLSGCCQHMHPE